MQSQILVKIISRLSSLRVSAVMSRFWFFMNSNSQSANVDVDTPPHRLADIVGTLIAILTLGLPMFVIAHYSSNNVEINTPQPITSRLQQSQD
jgi:hypothetical protein